MPAASNAGGFRRQAFIKSKNDKGKENIKQVNPALAAAGGALVSIGINKNKHYDMYIILGFAWYKFTCWGNHFLFWYLLAFDSKIL